MKTRRIATIISFIGLLILALLLFYRVSGLENNISALEMQNQQIEKKLRNYEVAYELLYQGPLEDVMTTEGFNAWADIRNKITAEEEILLIESIEKAILENEHEEKLKLYSAEYNLAAFWYFTEVDFDYYVKHVLEGRNSIDIYLQIKETGFKQPQKGFGRFIIKKLILLKVPTTDLTEKDIRFIY